MQADTLRRLLVFGVCLAGVGALYLVPGVTRAPQVVGGPAVPDDSPTARRSPGPRSSAPDATPTSTSATIGATTRTTTYAPPPPPPETESATARADRSATPSATTTRSSAPPASEPSGDDPAERRLESPASTPSKRTSSTPFVPGSPKDETPPTSVKLLELVDATPDQLRLVWTPSTDDSGIVSYRVWLDGYETKTTVDTTVTLDWFNDDNVQHVVQVHAVDTAGNSSAQPATLLVSRPTPTPALGTPLSGTPTPSQSGDASPSPDDESMTGGAG